MKAIWALALVVLLAGCDFFNYPKWEKSETMTEPAVVSDIIFSPSRHGSGVGVGIDTNGDIGISSVSVNVPEQYAVVFECQHGRFVIEGGKGSTAYQLWTRLKKLQPVTVHYREEYKITKYEEQEHKTIIGYDFLDALPR